MSQYYFSEGNEIRGPFAMDELKDQPIHIDSLVWREGFEGWQAAGQTPELAELFKPATSPPPPPVRPSQSLAADTPMPSQPPMPPQPPKLPEPPQPPMPPEPKLPEPPQPPPLRSSHGLTSHPPPPPVRFGVNKSSENSHTPQYQTYQGSMPPPINENTIIKTEKKRKAKVILAITLIIVLVSIGGYVLFKAGELSLSKQDSGSKVELRDDYGHIYNAWDFRQIATRNYAEALELYANRNACKKFAEMNENMWHGTDPAFGWAFFFDGVVLCPIGGNDETDPMAFYHPFADVFLVLIFDTGLEGKTLIDDAYMLAGDFVRKQGKTPFKPERHWTTQELFAPYALGLTAAETIKAFENLFPSVDAFNTVFDKLMSSDVIKVNQISAGVQLIETLGDLSKLLSSDKGSEFSPLVREKMIEINDHVLAGEMKEILDEAEKTAPEHREVLINMGIKDWRSYKYSGYLESDGYGMVMLQSYMNPDVYLSLLMKKRGEIMHLTRIDYLSFENFR